jgi:CheY-like chemotaxis protein
MTARWCLFTVRLLGFGPEEFARLETVLARVPGAGPSYFCLHQDSLQEPDVYIVNGDSPAALARLDSLPPGALHSALVIGAASPTLWPTLARPVEHLVLHDLLADLLDQRVQAQAACVARGERLRPERRRRLRIAPDAETPAFYSRLRHGPPDGAVLIVDKECTFRNHVARVMGARPPFQQRPLAWTDSLRAAVRLCAETPVSLVMINTAAPGIEPYELCSSIKSQEGAGRTPVLFLVEQSFRYDAALARRSGVRGLLDKPVAGRHLLLTFQKLLDLPP